MIRYIWTTVAFFLVFLEVANGGESSEEVTIGYGSERLALDMYQALNEDGKNFLVSPFSVQALLFVALIGAKGNTAKELVEALSLPHNRILTEEIFAVLHKNLSMISKNRLQIVNGLFLSQRFPVESGFEESADVAFSAKVQLADFAKDNGSHAVAAINSWISKETGGNIKSIVRQGAVNPSTTMVLLNGMYFKGLWKTKFRKSVSRQLPFHVKKFEQVMVHMMSAQGTFLYADDSELNAHVAAIPYKGNQLRFVMIVPKEYMGIKKVERALLDKGLSPLLKNLKRTFITVQLPSFHLQQTVELAQLLQQLGLKDIFSPNADFTGISKVRGLHVSQIIQQSEIRVSEEGTEGTSQGASDMPSALRFFNYRRVEANQPFIFFIEHVSTGIVLYMGSVQNPDWR